MNMKKRISLWYDAGWSQGSVCVEGDGLVGGQWGWGKRLYISVAGPCGGDGMGVSGEAAEWEEDVAIF